MDLFVAGRDQSAAGQPNNLAEGLPPMYLAGSLGEGFLPLPARKWMSGDGRQCLCGYHGHFDFLQSILQWHLIVRSLRCQHELQPYRDGWCLLIALITSALITSNFRLVHKIAVHKGQQNDQ